MVATLLPPAVAAQLISAPAVAVSGSRAPSPSSLAALRACLAAVPPHVPLFVGDASGIDHHAHLIRPDAQVFRAADPCPGLLAARSIALVRAAAAAGAVLAAFPAAPCPAALRVSVSPSRCFGGFGAGTWSSLAFAAGLGLALVVFLPVGVLPPPTFGLTSHHGGWYVCSAAQTTQMPLF